MRQEIRLVSHPEAKTKLDGETINMKPLVTGLLDGDIGQFDANRTVPRLWNEKGYIPLR